MELSLPALTPLVFSVSWAKIQNQIIFIRTRNRLILLFSSENIFCDSRGAEVSHWTTLRNFRRLARKRKRGKHRKKDFNYTTTQVFMTTESASSFVQLIRNQQSQCSPALIWAVEAQVCLNPSSLLPVSSFLCICTHWLMLQGFVSSLCQGLLAEVSASSTHFTSFQIDLGSLFQEPRWHSLPLFIKRLIIEAIRGVSAVLQNA